VRLYRRFPAKQPLELIDEIVTYVSLQLDIPAKAINAYQAQRQTVVAHQQELRGFLKVRRLGEARQNSTHWKRFYLRKPVDWSKRAPYRYRRLR
jgi:hypothetical protein